MTEVDKIEFVEIMKDLAILFDASLSAERLEIYFNLLKDKEIKKLGTVIRDIMKSARFFPLPVDILLELKKRYEVAL